MHGWPVADSKYPDQTIEIYALKKRQWTVLGEMKIAKHSAGIFIFWWCLYHEYLHSLYVLLLYLHTNVLALSIIRRRSR